MADTESTTRKTTPKKSAPKKAASRKSAPKKAATKKSSATSSSDGSAAAASTRKRPAAARAEAPKRMTGPQVAAGAARQLLELTGKESEGIIGLERTDDGWTVEVEVLELRRIPSTTDVLATYEVTVDRDGDMEGYRRLHRYVRGTPGDD